MSSSDGVKFIGANVNMFEYLAVKCASKDNLNTDTREGSTVSCQLKDLTQAFWQTYCCCGATSQQCRAQGVTQILQTHV